MRICHLTAVETKDPSLPLDHFSSYSKLTRVTAWVMRFINNCCAYRDKWRPCTSSLSVQEITNADKYWLSYSQYDCFSKEIGNLKAKNIIPSGSTLMTLHPFLDSNGILRVSGREQKEKLACSVMHPIILSGKHPLTKLIIRSEHLRLLHAGPTLLGSSLSCKYHIVGGSKSIRSITRSCITCLHQSEKLKSQQMGQLPIERVIVDSVRKYSSGSPHGRQNRHWRQ